MNAYKRERRSKQIKISVTEKDHERLKQISKKTGEPLAYIAYQLMLEGIAQHA